MLINRCPQWKYVPQNLCRRNEKQSWFRGGSQHTELFFGWWTSVCVSSFLCVVAWVTAHAGWQWEGGEFTAFPSQTIPNDYPCLLWSLWDYRWIWYRLYIKTNKQTEKRDADVGTLKLDIWLKCQITRQHRIPWVRLLPKPQLSRSQDHIPACWASACSKTFLCLSLRARPTYFRLLECIAND